MTPTFTGFEPATTSFAHNDDDADDECRSVAAAAKLEIISVFNEVKKFRYGLKKRNWQKIDDFDF